MTDTVKVESATNWLMDADKQDYEGTWKSSSTLFQTAVELDDWRRSLKSARSPLGTVITRTVNSVEPLTQPPGAPDGTYTKLLFNSSFELKHSAQETITLVEETDGQWRVAGYFIK